MSCNISNPYETPNCSGAKEERDYLLADAKTGKVYDPYGNCIGKLVKDKKKKKKKK